MAGHWVLVPGIGVRIPVPEQRYQQKRSHRRVGGGGDGKLGLGLADSLGRKEGP